MSASGQPAVTPERIMQMSWGYAAPLMMEVGVRHGIFDRLDSGPKTADEVAALAGVSPRATRIIMNGLAAIQLLTKDPQGRFGLAPDAAAFLVSTKPGFLGGLARHTSTRTLPTWMKLSQVLETGKPAEGGLNQEDLGSTFFQSFVADLFPLGYRPAQILADALKLPAADKPVRVLDLGAGSGVWSIAMAQKSPQVTVTAMDWPAVLEVARSMAGRFGVAERFSFKAGNIVTDDYGSGYNIVMLGQILHMFGEQHARALVKKAFQALAPGGTIAIADILVDDARTSPPLGLIFAVNMLVNTEEGDTYSFNEMAAWLRDAGFEDVRAVETQTPSPIIVANRPA
jgi:2-polyprenyl-3-methyl-5-hydroxy-6-metoxy-1,4-benzoquinol methylase